VEQADITDPTALLDVGTRHKITGMVHLTKWALGRESRRTTPMSARDATRCTPRPGRLNDVEQAAIAFARSQSAVSWRPGMTREMAPCR